MKWGRTLFLSLNLTLFLLNQSAFGIPNRKPNYLRCEYLINPLGIDVSHPRLTWQITDGRIGAREKWYSIYVGTDSLQVNKGIGVSWESGKINSSACEAIYNGIGLKPFTKYFWCVRLGGMDDKKISPSGIASFETGMMEVRNWKGSWISDSQNIDFKPAPYFRKAFTIVKRIKSARAYIAAGGLYELYINGKKVGDHRLDPMYTRYDRRNLYVTYNITGQLKIGENAIGVLLGNGWYNLQSRAVWRIDKAPWRARPTFCLDIRVIYTDGTVETISSGNDWKTSLSPIIFNSIYTGEHYDDRLEQPGWNTVSFNDSSWTPVILRSAPSQNIVTQVLYPIRNVQFIPAISLNKINDTTYVFNLGRNISGVSKLKVKGNNGTIIRLIHGERLFPNGHVDLSNIDIHYRPTDNTDPFQTDIFILNGKGEETFMPHFNYKGFQYVEVVSNQPIYLNINSLGGYFMHSDVPPIGQIESSNPTIDKIWQATNNSYLSNFFGCPTDCPQREKNGWTGDAAIAIETGLYNFDGITIYEKWMADHRDEQQPNGVLPAIIPTGGWGYEWANGPDWTSTIAIIPWNIYLFYGDIKLLSDCYINIKRYVNHIEEISPSGLTSWGLGDWVPVKSKTPVEFTSSIYYFIDASILSKASRLLGRENDHEEYLALAIKIKKAINDKYLNKAKGIYGNGVQTELSVPLYWGIVPDGLRSKVAFNLAAQVKADNYHLDVGLLGTKAILNALSDNGYADIAYKLASQETFPSWGWWIVNGASTLYENWDIDAKRDISLNHIMFGEIGAWFYNALGGIKTDLHNPGFKNVFLEPKFVADLDYFKAEHNGPYGKISSQWKRSQGRIIYKVIIPPNSTATIRLELKPNQKVFKNGLRIDRSMKQIPYFNNSLSAHISQIEIPAGAYKFEIQ